MTDPTAFLADGGQVLAPSLHERNVAVRENIKPHIPREWPDTSAMTLLMRLTAPRDWPLVMSRFDQHVAVLITQLS